MNTTKQLKLPSIFHDDKDILCSGLLSNEPDQAAEPNQSVRDVWQSQVKRIFDKLTALSKEHDFRPDQIDSVTIMVCGTEKDYRECVKAAYNFFFVGVDRPPTTVLPAIVLPYGSLIQIDFSVNLRPQS